MIKVIPAIDIMEGKCVRLSQGSFDSQKVYTEDPVAQAQAFEAAGFRQLHLVDLDGARNRYVVNLDILSAIAKSTKLHIDFGGGVQSEDDLKRVLEAGAKQVTAGSIAIKNEALLKQWLSHYGPETIILGADTRNGMIAVAGWRETTGIKVVDFIQKITGFGIKYVICTEVTRDGLLKGPDLELYKQLRSVFPELCIIASGGVSSIEDIDQLNTLGLYGVIVGKAIYEGKITFEELKPYLQRS